MRVKKMTATFGKLQNASLTLGPGLNIVQAPNEGGKSTWCGFLRAMLYGIPTKERDRKDALAEKNRYQPWAGGALEGALTLSWRGQDITLRRGPKGTTPFGSFSATETGTEAPVPGLTGENAGETLLGVSREVFERSAFVGQGGAAIGANEELERRIAALVSSGEETVSYSQVEARLREWQRRRQFNRSGLLPKLENERVVIGETLARQSYARHQEEEARGTLAALAQRRQVLQRSLEASRTAANLARRQEYQGAVIALQEAQNRVAALRAEQTKGGTPPGREALRRAQEDLSYLNTVTANRRLADSQLQQAQQAAAQAQLAAEDALFPGLTAQEAWQQASWAAAQVSAQQSAQTRAMGQLWKGGLVGLAVGALVAAGGAALLPQWRWLWLGGGCGILAIGLVVTALLCKASGAKHGAQAQQLLAQYGATYPDDILACAAAYRENCVLAAEAEKKRETVAQALGQLEEEQQHLLQTLLDMAHTFAPTVRDIFGVSAAISKALALEEQLATAMVRLEGAKTLVERLPRPQEGLGGVPGVEALPPEALDGDPAETAAQLTAVEREMARLENAQALAQGELNSLGDPALFEARREALTQAIADRQGEYQALSVALEELAQANAQLQARFSPALNALAGEFMGALTGGRYEKVTLTRDFEALAQETASPLPRRGLSLSQGTVEQLYLAVRLAVCHLALPGDEAPLVLDDALDAFDDTRMALALALLRREGRQVLLFTCHSRECAWAAAHADVTTIQLPESAPIPSDSTACNLPRIDV